jgi:hypothetical protein
MSGSSKQPRATLPDLAGMDANSEPTNQEAVVLKYVAGEYIANAQWLSPAYNQRAVESPTARPGKK